MTALLRSITFFTAIALLLFVGLHAVVPHEHPHQGETHFSEVPPFAHADNKIIILALLLASLPFLFDVAIRMKETEREGTIVLYKSVGFVAQTVPVRYAEALRKGRIHSRAH